MFKWPDVPSDRASIGELADFAELLCWQKTSTSLTALCAALGRLAENDYTDGVPEEEETPRIVGEAYSEIERRKEACRDGYPFVISEDGYTLTMAMDNNNRRHSVYRYLLLATRLNMATARVHAGIDGTLLLEELAADVGREYLGARAESLIFGANSGTANFPGRVDELCRRLQEGGNFVSHNAALPTAKDGKLDVVVWKHFNDYKPGKLIAFGQCKTGTNFRDSVTQLQPDSFCRKWLRVPPTLVPVRMFFAAEAISRLSWYDIASDTGLLFDRCRIVDFSDELTGDVLARLRAWTEGAAIATGLPV